jgi:chloride channel protein, CIC family
MRDFAILRHHLDTGLLIGALAGVAGIGFHYLADQFGALLFSWVETNRAHIRLPLVILVPTMGLCLVGFFLQKVPASALGGVREVADALNHQGSVIPLSRALNVILSGLVLAFGGSVGPEGPTVQIGALIGSKVGQRFVVGTTSLKTMVRAGAAAGIARAFRSPAGGILLTIEILGARFDGDLPVIGIALWLAT